jgi:undecaprenyl-diphosphatase
MHRFDYSLERIHAWDRSLALYFNHAGNARMLRALFRVVSRLGDGLFWYALMGSLLLWQGREALPGVGHMAVTGAVGLLMYKWLKGRTSRPRPYQCHQGVVCLVPPLDQYSFPSGHTLHAVAFSIVAGAYFPPLTPALAGFTLLVSLSRVTLGLHYPTDVAAGAAIGALIAASSLWLGSLV